MSACVRKRGGGAGRHCVDLAKAGFSLACRCQSAFTAPVPYGQELGLRGTRGLNVFPGGRSLALSGQASWGLEVPTAHAAEAQPGSPPRGPRKRSTEEPECRWRAGRWLEAEWQPPHSPHLSIWSVLFPFFFLGPCLQHMEVPRLGIQSELWLPAYTTATATQDPSRVCGLHHSSQQCWIPNPLSEARDGTCNLMVPSRAYETRLPLRISFRVKTISESLESCPDKRIGLPPSHLRCMLQI